jgi:hypothetical protein
MAAHGFTEDSPYHPAGEDIFPGRPFSAQIIGGTMCKTGQGLARLALLGLGLLLAGCSRYSEVRYPETGATLEGTVTYGTDKVGAALVIAQNETGAATAFVEENGRYKLNNVPLGQVSIGVNTEAGKGKAMGEAMAQAKGKSKAPPRIVDVPSHFADPAKSGIKTTIKEGANTFDIAIPR